VWRLSGVWGVWSEEAGAPVWSRRAAPPTARAPPADFAPAAAIAAWPLLCVEGLSFRSGHTVLFNDTNTRKRASHLIDS
jgi:hypothetical protein